MSASKDPRDAHITERDVQKGCINFLKQTGWSTWRVGQRDARGTQDAGVSDLICFHPMHGIAFVEVKRAKGGKQSQAQKDFQQAVELAGGRYVLASSSVDVVTLSYPQIAAAKRVRQLFDEHARGAW